MARRRKLRYLVILRDGKEHVVEADKVTPPRGTFPLRFHRDGVLCAEINVRDLASWWLADAVDTLPETDLSSYVEIGVTQITRVEGRDIDPVEVRVVERFLPRQDLLIEVDDMPRELIRANPSTIRISSSSVDIQVLHKTWPSIAPGEPGTLSPMTVPCRVVEDSELLHEVRFDALNFHSSQRMLGAGSRWRSDVSKNRSYLIGRADIRTDPWRITLEEVDNIGASGDRSGSFRVAHTGSISRLDGKSFRCGDGLSILSDLRQFLSFAGGSEMGFSRVHQGSVANFSSLLRWGTEITAPLGFFRSSWLPLNTATDAISCVFTEYCRQVGSNTRIRFALDYVMQVYLESLEGSLYTVIPHIQIALDTLCGLITCRRGQVQDQLEATLRSAAITLDIPDWFPRLDEFRAAEELTGGPATLVALRDYVVQGDPKVAAIDTFVLWEAHQLGLWYVELLLLFQLKYRGKYRIRANGSVERVPWSTG